MTAERFRPPEQEQRSRRLLPLLADMAAAANTELVRCGADPAVPVLGPDGSISLRSFIRKHGGPYHKETAVRPDEQFVQDREYEWSDAANPKTQAWHGVSSPEAVAEKFRAERLESNGVVLEMALTVLLHRLIGNEFIVARASVYDDYANGVDTVIIDKTTGDVVCTFDEVTDDAGGNRYAQKLEKTTAKAKRGGTTIRYGLTFEADAAGNRQLVKQEITHVPLFYLALDRQQLNELLAALPTDIHQPPNDTELALFDHLMTLLERQALWLAHEDTVAAPVRQRIVSFQASLDRMRQLRARYQTSDMTVAA